MSSFGWKEVGQIGRISIWLAKMISCKLSEDYKDT